MPFSTRLLLAAALAALAATATPTAVVAATTLTNAPGSQSFVGFPTPNLRPGLFISDPQVSIQTTLSIFTSGPVDTYYPPLLASIVSADRSQTVLVLTCAPL